MRHPDAEGGRIQSSLVMRRLNETGFCSYEPNSTRALIACEASAAKMLAFFMVELMLRTQNVKVPSFIYPLQDQNDECEVFCEMNAVRSE